MPGLLETDSFSAQSITSAYLAGSYTAAAAGWVMPQVRLNGLNGAAAVITLKLVLNDGTNDHPHARGSDLKDADADTRFARDLPAVWMSSGDVLKVYVLSSNASDTSVSGSVRFVDAGNPVGEVSADVTKISGSGTAADNLELAGLAYSATRGLAGTALPDAAADAAGGLPVSDAGGLDMDGALPALSIAGEVDDSAVTPAAGTFAGDVGLSASNDFYNNALLAFTSGAMAGLVRPVVDYVGATRTITVSPAFPSVPADGDRFRIIGRA